MDISRLAQKLREADFEPDESVIASSIMHPIEAAKRGAEWFGGQVNRAVNIPDPFDNPNPTRGYTPEQQLEAGLNLAGMAQTGALPMAPSTRGGTLGSIAVSHGSPHKFDQFSLSRIGSGEGSQAYGHGLYFGEGFDSPVAKTYSEIANRGGSTQYGLSKEGRDLRVLDSIIRVSAGQHTGGDVKELASLIEKHPKAFADPEALIARIAEYENNAAPAYMYNAELRWPDAAREAADPMGPHHFLDWDRPLSEQSKNVQNLLSKFEIPDKKMTGQEINSFLKEIAADKSGFIGASPDFYKQFSSKSSEMLNNAGIPGIRYLDQGSRGAGQGTSNYVVFDDEIPKIISRNGVELARLLREK